MSEIILVRHAEVRYRGTYQDKYVHLTKQGRRAAQELSRLTLPDIAAIYSSPLPRCIETVEPLSRRLGIEIQRRPGLEELDYRGNAQEFHARVDDDPDFHYQGGETLGAARSRFTDELTGLAASHPDEAFVASTHGTVLSQFLIHSLGAPSDVFFSIGYPAVYALDYQGQFTNLRVLT